MNSNNTSRQAIPHGLGNNFSAPTSKRSATAGTSSLHTAVAEPFGASQTANQDARGRQPNTFATKAGAAYWSLETTVAGNMS